ncbi:MAG: hypothetical protein HXY20_09885, partial [Acidobacteria bacterium]|nr:hypothetical protein [Acidobacteriota bacterium]
QAQAAIARAVRAFQDRLEQAINKALRIEFAGAQFQGDMEEPSSPDVRISKTFDIPIDMLWFVIPMTIFRPLVNRHILAKIPWEVEKNLSRLSAQWADASNLCLDDLARQAQEFIRNELAVVSRLVIETRDRSPEIRAALDAIAALESMGLPADAADGSSGA